jgi:hypothetical protein
MMTENGTFCGHKITPPWKLFFSVGNNFFYVKTLIQLPMAGLKIKFSNNFFDRVSFGQFRTKITPPWKLFFFRRKPKQLFYNFKSATDGGLKNVIFEKKIDRVP